MCDATDSTTLADYTDAHNDTSELSQKAYMTGMDTNTKAIYPRG